MPYSDPQKQREYRRKYLKEWRKKNRDKFNAWRREKKFHLKQLYGITAQDRQRMLNYQDGKCAICKRPESETAKKTLCVDHNHQTEKVRGLLCNQCNSLLGYAKESAETLQAAIEYLRRFNN